MDNDEYGNYNSSLNNFFGIDGEDVIKIMMEFYVENI